MAVDSSSGNALALCDTYESSHVLPSASDVKLVSIRGGDRLRQFLTAALSSTVFSGANSAAVRVRVRVRVKVRVRVRVRLRVRVGVRVGVRVS